VLNTPLLATLFRKRLKSCSCDSFGLSVTVVKNITSFFYCVLQQKTANFIGNPEIKTAGDRGPANFFQTLKYIFSI
jgi:hypothetical protein